GRLPEAGERRAAGADVAVTLVEDLDAVLEPAVHLPRDRQVALDLLRRQQRGGRRREVGTVADPGLQLLDPPEVACRVDRCQRRPGEEVVSGRPAPDEDYRD